MGAVSSLETHWLHSSQSRFLYIQGPIYSCYLHAGSRESACAQTQASTTTTTQWPRFLRIQR